MARPLKILFALVGGLLLLLLALVVALPLLFDPNDYKSQIAEAVKKETGRDFAVGTIRLSVFPWLRVELQDLTLGNAVGFGSEPMLTVQRAEVGARLMPLLRERRVEASTVRLEGIAARLAVNAEGQDNWSDLAKPKAQASAGDAPGQDKPLRDLDIEGLSLADLTLDYRDARSGQELQLTVPQLKTGRLHGSEPFSVEGEAQLQSRQPAAAAQLGFAAEVRRNAESGDIALAQPRLQLAAQQPGAKPLAVKLKVETDSLAYLKATQLIETGALQLEIEQFVSGPADQPLLSATGRIGTLLKSDLAGKRHTLTNLDADLQLAGSALPGGKPQALRLTATLDADLAAQQLAIRSPQLAVLGLRASGKLWQVKGLTGEAPQAEGDLAIAAFDPRALMATLGIAVPQTADAGALKSASVDTGFAASATALSLSPLAVKLDETNVRGELAVRDLKSKLVTFDLKADRLDADRYLPPPPKPAAATTDAPPAAKADFNATPLPFKALRELPAQGRIAIASLKLRKLKLADASLKLDGAPGAPRRQQLSTRLYGGSAELAMRLAPGAPNALKLSLTGIDALPLLKDFMDSDKLSGRGSMTLDVTSLGDTMGEARKSLDGTLAFNLADGAVKGFNLGKIIRDGQALLAMQSNTKSEPQSTDFAELRGAGVFTNGVLRSDQLSAKNPLIRLEGAGEVNLVNETIDYTARPTLVNTAGGQGGKERADLSGIVIPIRITGALAKPEVSIDWEAALKQRAAVELREKLGVSEETVREKREELRGKVKEELNKALGEDLSKSLQSLFGKKPAPPPPQEPTPAPEPAPAPPL